MRGSVARLDHRSFSLHKAAEQAARLPSATTGYLMVNGLLWIALPRQDKLSYRFLRTCSTPHTLASALPALLYNQYNVSLFSTYARQLTTQHHLDSRTWLFGFVSMCQDKVRRRCTRRAVHESPSTERMQQSVVLQSTPGLSCDSSAHIRSTQPHATTRLQARGSGILVLRLSRGLVNSRHQLPHIR
jgi:hypothetical protein